MLSALPSAADVISLAPTGHLEVLLVADTDDASVGEAMSHELRELQRVLEWIQNRQPKRLQIEVLTGSQVSPEAILSHYRQRRGRSTCSQLFFYLGHGGLDPINGHFLATNRGALYRRSLWTAMENTGAPLSVVLTNCCSNVPGVMPPNRDEGRTPAWEAFEQLFFEHRGLVDITAAEDGTFAWGGLFSSSFTSLICDPVASSDRNHDAFVSWEEFAGRLRAETEARFREVKALSIAGDYPRNEPHDLRDFASQRPQINFVGYFDLLESPRHWQDRAAAWQDAAGPAMVAANLVLDEAFAQFSQQTRQEVACGLCGTASRCFSNAVACEARAIEVAEVLSMSPDLCQSIRLSRSRNERLAADWAAAAYRMEQ